MAYKDNLKQRILKINPKALSFLEEFNTLIPPGSVTVTTTEDMTDEEKEMELFAGFLKEGYSPEIAQKKAKEWLKISKWQHLKKSYS